MSRSRSAILALAILAAVPVSGLGQSPSELPRKLQVFEAGDETFTRYVRLRSRIREFESDGRIVGGRIQLSRFSGQLGQGKIECVGSLDWNRKSGPQSAFVTLENVDSRQFLAAFNLDFDARVVTRVTGRLDVRWQGLRMPSMRRTLTGKMQMQTGSGRVDKSTVFDALARETGIADLAVVDFESCTGTAQVTDGIVRFDNAWIRGKNLRILAIGEVDIPSDSVRIKVHFFLAPDLAERSTRPEIRAAGALLAQVKDLRESDGFVRIPVPVVLTGTFSKPEATFAGFDVGKLAKPDIPEGKPLSRRQQ